MIFAILSLLLADASHAQPSASCAATDSGLPAALANWANAPTPATIVQPQQSVQVATNAAIPLHIENAGVYGIAMNIPAWIDVRRGDSALTSSGHAHGPDCSSIRKIVRFTLDAGDYTIHLSRTEASSAHLLVIPQS